MSIEVHLSLLILTAVAFATTVLLARGPADRRVREVVLASAPVLFIGLVSSLLMLAGGKPILEWLLPLLGIVVIGWRCKTQRVFRAVTIAAPLAAAALVLHFLQVAHTDGVTNAPDALTRITQQRESIALKKAVDALRSTFDSESRFPAGPIRSILPDVDSAADVVELKRVRPEWHSAVTHLYRVENLQGTVWYPGGEVGEASQKLEVRVETGEAS